ncbi:polyamine aminopropyltransferase [Magnetospira sp. QH-2]|uniref:polyamine aminopropyltransferase n=1 Tax=Magnetospira sp. (strain QH-2) TaxID=1288970 RepID=UPI0003E81834|nr:polyamine aminopropyltransferase [Magnetospira sp. QH-2]CCQ74114.1 Spermidine synthase (putrescine aminopropyltransferase) [Magnetospira sp. QH-2]
MTRFDELLHKGYWQSFEVEEVLFEEKNDLQHLVIFQSPSHGRVLALDNIVQVTEADNFFYHEMLAHLPIIAHGAVTEVLIIGGGDGGTLKEVLRHPGVQATLVEIDQAVVDLCVKYMPSVSAGAFDDPRCDLVIADGLKYVAETDKRFDIIIVDSTDPVGPGEVLFSESFYRDCKRCLKPGGLLATQNGVPFFQPEEVTTTYGRLNPIFEDVWFFQTPVPTYVGGMMTLAWATDDPSLRHQPVEDLVERFVASGITTRYYTPGIHWGSLHLPPYITDMMDQA